MPGCPLNQHENIHVNIKILAVKPVKHGGGTNFNCLLLDFPNYTKFICICPPSELPSELWHDCLTPVTRRTSPLAPRPSLVARCPPPVAGRSSPVARRPSLVARLHVLSLFGQCFCLLTPGCLHHDHSII